MATTSQVVQENKAPRFVLKLKSGKEILLPPRSTDNDRGGGRKNGGHKSPLSGGSTSRPSTSNAGSRKEKLPAADDGGKTDPGAPAALRTALYLSDYFSEFGNRWDSQTYQFFRNVLGFLSTQQWTKLHVCSLGLGREFRNFLRTVLNKKGYAHMEEAAKNLFSIGPEPRASKEHLNLALQAYPPQGGWIVIPMSAKAQGEEPIFTHTADRHYWRYAGMTYSCPLPDYERVMAGSNFLSGELRIWLPKPSRGGGLLLTDFVQQEGAFVPNHLEVSLDGAAGMSARAYLVQKLRRYRPWYFWVEQVTGKRCFNDLLRVLVARMEKESWVSRMETSELHSRGEAMLRETSWKSILGSGEKKQTLLSMVVRGVGKLARSVKALWDDKFNSPEEEDPLDEWVMVPGCKGKEEEGSQEDERFFQTPQLLLFHVHRSMVLRRLKIADNESRRLLNLARRPANHFQEDFQRAQLRLTKKEWSKLVFSYLLEEGATWLLSPAAIVVAIVETCLDIHTEMGLGLTKREWRLWTLKVLLPRFAVAFARTLLPRPLSILLHAGYNLVCLLPHLQSALQQGCAAPTLRLEEMVPLWPVSVPKTVKPFLSPEEDFAELRQVQPWYFDVFSSEISPQESFSNRLNQVFLYTQQDILNVKLASLVRCVRSEESIKELEALQACTVRGEGYVAFADAIAALQIKPLPPEQAAKGLSQHSRKRAGNFRFGDLKEPNTTLYVINKQNENLPVKPRLTRADTGAVLDLPVHADSLSGDCRYAYIKPRLLFYSAPKTLYLTAPTVVAASQRLKELMKKQGYFVKLHFEHRAEESSPGRGFMRKLTIFFCYGFVPDFAKHVLTLRQEVSDPATTIVVVYTGGDDLLIGISTAGATFSSRFPRKHQNFVIMEFDYKQFDKCQSRSILEWFWSIGGGYGNFWTQAGVEFSRKLYANKVAIFKQNIDGKIVKHRIPYYGGGITGEGPTSLRNTFISDGTITDCLVKAWRRYDDFGAPKKKERDSAAIMSHAEALGFQLTNEDKGFPTFLACAIAWDLKEFPSRGIRTQLLPGRYVRAGLFRPRDLPPTNLGITITELQSHLGFKIVPGTTGAYGLLPESDAGGLLLVLTGLLTQLMKKPGTKHAEMKVQYLSPVEAHYVQFCEKLFLQPQLKGWLVSKLRDHVFRWQRFSVEPHIGLSEEELTRLWSLRYQLSFNEPITPIVLRTLVSVDYGVESEAWEQAPYARIGEGTSSLI